MHHSQHRQRFSKSYAKKIASCARFASHISALAVVLVTTANAHEHATPALFYLDLAGQVVRSNIDGTNISVIAQSQGKGPDGIAIDQQAGHVYWTNMGKVREEDGSIIRADFDGSHVTTIVPVGGTFTPKQLKIDTQHRKLYWSDREGMRVMRANLDGTKIETLVVTGSGAADRTDPSKWCVGIALDVAHGKLYWTQKGGDNAGKGVIKRANLELPAGEDAAHRSDIEVLFANLPEPIDIDLDLNKRFMYWTDRGDNTVSRAPMDVKLDVKSQFNPAARTDRKILVRDLHEFIGISLDLQHKRMYYTSLEGEIGSANLDGSDAKLLLTDKNHYTGIAYAELPH